MKGRVKNVNEDREFGFILGEDGNDYFFHFSNVISVDLPTKNSIVDFETAQTEKGASATNIKIEDKAIKKPEFVKFGSVRIRLKDIKSYAIYSGYYETGIVEREPGNIQTSYVGNVYKSLYHLKITTFQKDVYRFTMKEFDIEAKRDELDKYFTE